MHREESLFKELLAKLKENLKQELQSVFDKYEIMTMPKARKVKGVDIGV